MFGGTIEGLTVVIGADASRVETALSGLKSQFSSFGSELSGISNEFNLDNVASQFDRVAGGMQKMGAAMSLMVGVPMGLLAKESIGMFADLESQIQRNTALLNGGKAEYEQILALSKELGASSPFDALEISKGIESLAAAGYSLQEIQAAMPTITNMAVATGEDLNSMSEILVATLNSYGEAADKAGMYGDKLATIANISSAGVTDFGESIKYVGGVVKAFGVDIDELGAVLGALADVNIKGSSAGTTLRSIITDLVSPTAAVNDIFASFGLTMDELNPKTNDFVEILQKMKDAGVSDEALMAAFQERGGPVAIQMINQLDKIKENYNTLQNESAGMLEDFAAQMRDTLGFVMDEMGGTISNIMIEIGEGLKPIVEEIGAWLNENQQTLIDFAKNAVDGLTPFVTKFMDLAKKLMDWFNSLPEDLQSKIAGLTGLGGAMATIGGPLLLLGSLPVSGGVSLLKTLETIGTLAITTTAVGGVSTLVTSLNQLSKITPIPIAQYTAPIGPAMAGATTAVAGLSTALLGIGAAAGIGLALYATNLGDFRTNVDGILKSVTDAISHFSSGEYSQAGRDMANAVAGGFETVSDLITKGIPDASRIFYEFNVGLMDATTDMTRGLGQATGGFIRELSSDISNAISDLQSSLPELVIPTKIDPPNKAEYEANMKEFLDGAKSVIDNYDLSDSSTRFVTKAAVNLVTSGMGGNSIELVHQIGTFFKGIYEEGIIHAVDEFIATNPRMGLDKVEEHFKNSMNSSDFSVASEYIGKMKTEMQTAFQGLEKEIETPLRNAGVSVKEFATQSAADIHNAMEKWQESFKESKLSYEEWMESLKKSGQFDEYIADMQKYAETFPEITKEAGSAAQVIQGLDFMPVEFKAGNSIYANYKNNVLTPIVSEPIQIMLENATESEFNYILTHYNEIKNQIENSPINITYVGPAGDPNPNWGVTPHYTPDIQPNPNNAAPVIAEETGKSVAEQLARDRKMYDRGELDIAASEAGTKTGAEAGTEAGAKAGVESLIPSLREYVEKQGKQGLSDADIEKYRPLYNKEYGLAAKATKEETEAKKKGTKELTNFSGSFEEATRAAIAANEKGSWTNNGKTYKINQNTGLAESQDLADIIAQNKQEASDKESAKAIKDSLKEQEKLFGAFAAGLNPEKVADSLFSKYGSDALTGKQIQIGDLLYNLQQNSKGGLNISGTDQASKEILNALNTIEATTKSLQTEQAKQTKTNKNGEITGGPDQSKISQYNSEIKAAQDILNKYGVSQTKGIQSTDLLNTSLDKASTSTSNLDKSVQTTGDNILNFSDPVKVATNNVFTFGPAVSSATEALLQVPGAIDKILNVESSAMDSLAESRSKQLQQDFDASVNASDLKKSITEYLTESAYWTTKTAIGSGHTEDSYIYQDNLKGDLLAQLIEMQNPVDFAPSGWARRTQASEWLSSQNTGTQTQYLQIVDDLMTRLEQIDFYEGVKSGKVKAVAEEGEVDMGHLSRRVDIVGLDGLNTGVEKTGTEAKTTTPQINALNSAFEKIGLTGSGLSDVLSNVNTALSDHHANIQESKDYLSQYNDAAGENVRYTKDQEGQTKDLMNSLGMLGTAQNMYNQYMSDGVLDATQSAHVQQALAAATKMMGDAGITAEGGISGLPGALQALASAAQAAMSQIQAAISNANTVVQNAQTTAANIFKFGAPYTPGAMPASQLSGPQYSPYTGPTVFNPSSESVIAAQNISRYGVCRNGDWLRQFASGGPVTENGPAMLHQGEYVLRRDEVNRPTSGSPNVNLNINMSNSRFGNSEMQKDLPKRIARETRRALARSGI